MTTQVCTVIYIIMAFMCLQPNGPVYIYGNIYFKSNSGPEFIEMITHKELAFQRDGKIYTCWFLAFKPGQIEAKCNCDLAYTNSLGYKAVTLDFKDIIVLKGDI